MGYFNRYTCIKKISKNDSHIVIDSLLYALYNKIKTINSILDDTFTTIDKIYMSSRQNSKYIIKFNKTYNK